MTEPANQAGNHATFFQFKEEYCGGYKLEGPEDSGEQE
jgi:hypothetical protein